MFPRHDETDDAFRLRVTNDPTTIEDLPDPKHREYLADVQIRIMEAGKAAGAKILSGAFSEPDVGEFLDVVRRVGATVACVRGHTSCSLFPGGPCVQDVKGLSGK